VTNPASMLGGALPGSPGRAAPWGPAKVRAQACRRGNGRGELHAGGGGVAPHRGVSASVQSGNLVCGGKSQSVQSKQGEMPGRMTRAWPLKPSVPPSTSGLTVARSGLPSASNSAARARAGSAPAGRAGDRAPGTLGFSGLHTGRTYAVQFTIIAGAGAQPPPCNLPYLRGRRAGLGAHPGSCRRPGS